MHHSCLFFVLPVFSMALLLLLLPVPAAGEEPRPVVSGIAMTGSLYALSPVTIPQGGLISSDSFFIVVFNHRSEPATINLTYVAPNGIELRFTPPDTVFTIPPGGHRRVRVAIAVSNETPPGLYTVYVVAKLVRQEEGAPGARVLVAAAQRILVRVVGEAAYLSVRVLDPGGSLVENSLVRVYSLNGTSLISVMDSRGGVLSAKIVPGRYRVAAYLSGEEVAAREVTLRDGDNVSLVLTARVLYVERFTIRPVLSAEGELLAARLHVVIKNLYKTLSGVTVVLSVWRDGAPLENRSIVASSTLPRGRSEYTLDYVPPGGFRPGNYTMRVLVYAFGGKLVAMSPARWINVEASGAPLWLLVGAPGVLGAVLAAALVAWRRRRREKGG